MFHVELSAEERIARSADALGLALGNDTVDRLAELAELVATLGVEAGVISRGDGGVVVDRHIIDSLRAAPLVDGGLAYDLGSGGGLPGLVLAAVRPDLEVVMVDRRRRKVGFVEVALDRLALANGQAVLSEIEKLEAQVPVCLARALAPPERSWELSAPLLAPGGRLIYFGGKGFGGVGPLPDLVSCETVQGPLLESGGPLAIMTHT